MAKMGTSIRHLPKKALPGPPRSHSSRAPQQPLNQVLLKKEKEIGELSALVATISRGKYMWESTFDAITNPVMIVSRDYKVLRANKAAAREAAIDVRTMIGQTCFETLAGRDDPCPGCPLRETIAASRDRYSALQPFRKNGKQYDVNAYPLGSLGDVEQAVVHYRDVTEEKDLQRKLMQSEKMAAIGMLAGGVAHEINNPLGGILAFTQLIMRDLGQGHTSQNDLKEIEEAALRCKRIVQDLLDFSHQNREEVFGPVQINDVIRKIVPLVSVQARASHIQFDILQDENLGFVRGSPHKLQQVFLNLVANACQSMRNGGRLILKTFAMNDGPPRVCAEISDTGSGIPSEHLDRIFDPYFTTKDHGEGTGLGLSISYGIVKDHGGQIQVKSEPGKGSTFLVSFPVMDKTRREAS